METIILAGGCFWCTEAIFSQLHGVESVESGYIGGTLTPPNYEAVSRGNTGHAEAIKICFDPEKISLAQLFNIFFHSHNPCTLNQQGNDYGTQYRSAIFYATPEQKHIAQAAIDIAQTEFNSPIVTSLEPASAFYPAERVHQKFYLRNPNNSYCLFIIAPKIEELIMNFPEHLKGMKA